MPDPTALPGAGAERVPVPSDLVVDLKKSPGSCKGFVLYHGTNTFWIRIPHGDLGTNCVELGLHLAEHALMKLVPIYMFSMGAGTKT